MNKELLKKKEDVMSAACELCRWPADFGEDEEVLYEEHCNHCPVALAVDALCEALRTEDMIDGSQLSKSAKDLVKYAPEVINNTALKIDSRTEALVMLGKACKTNAYKLRTLPAKELADEIFNNLAQFPSRDALLAYLREEAKE